MFILSKVTIEGDVNGAGEVNTRDPETADSYYGTARTTVKRYLSCFQEEINFCLLFVWDEIATYSQNRFSLQLQTDVNAYCKRIHCSYRTTQLSIYTASRRLKKELHARKLRQFVLMQIPQWLDYNEPGPWMLHSRVSVLFRVLFYVKQAHAWKKTWSASVQIW